MKTAGVAFGAVCALWFALLPLTMMAAPRGLMTFTWPIAVGLMPIAALIARKKGQPRLAWSLLAAPAAWIGLTLVVSSLAKA